MIPLSRLKPLLILAVVISQLSCHISRQQQEDIATRCCRECIEAFSQSPVGVGAAGAPCGNFTTAKPLSRRCQDYFGQYPQTVEQCE